MDAYKNILLAADFTEHGEVVGRRAFDLAQRYQSRLSVVHVVDNLPITDAAYGPIIPFGVDLAEELVEAAKKRLAKLGEQFSIPSDRQWVEIGSAKLEIIRIAQQNDVDLIVVGSHGRHGLGLLLGSTADGVLHHATCDVMAVRLQND
ncbi:MAG: universal stress protein [Pseudomonadota bacterium]